MGGWGLRRIEKMRVLFMERWRYTEGVQCRYMLT